MSPEPTWPPPLPADSDPNMTLVPSSVDPLTPHSPLEATLTPRPGLLPQLALWVPSHPMRTATTKCHRPHSSQQQKYSTALEADLGSNEDLLPGPQQGAFSPCSHTVEVGRVSQALIPPGEHHLWDPVTSRRLQLLGPGFPQMSVRRPDKQTTATSEESQRHSMWPCTLTSSTPLHPLCVPTAVSSASQPGPPQGLHNGSPLRNQPNHTSQESPLQ